MLIIITFLPLGLYLYLNKGVQTTFIANIDNNQNKYIIDAEFSTTNKNINASGKITFFNRTKDKMDKIYLYLNNDIKVADARVNKKEVGYKIIGNKNILMVRFSEEIQSQDSVDIDINFLLEVNDERLVKETGKVINYELDIWYPVVIYHDNNGWNLKSAINNKPHLIECNHYIRIFIPSEFILDMTDIRYIETNVKDNGGFYHITKKTQFLPIIIKKFYDRN